MRCCPLPLLLTIGGRVNCGCVSVTEVWLGVGLAVWRYEEHVQAPFLPFQQHLIVPWACQRPEAWEKEGGRKKHLGTSFLALDPTAPFPRACGAPPPPFPITCL